MPRRKRAFIQRPSAKTYQLVHVPTAEDPHNHVFISGDGSTNGTPTTSNDVTTDASELQQTYNPSNFELGEYGFPEDGYDYSKHFRSIGGGGGVFMSAATGMADPDAVRATPIEKPKIPTAGGVVALREDIDTTGTTTAVAGARAVEHTDASQPSDSIPSWRKPRDEENRRRAIDEIRKERKRDIDLDAVFAALDSDGELSGDESGAADDEDFFESFASPADANDTDTDDAEEVLEDDFVLRATRVAENEDDGQQGEATKNEQNSLIGIVENFREPRLLDEQFDKFMQGYELEQSDDEEVEEYKATMKGMMREEEDNIDDISALLTQDEIAAMGGELGDAEIVEGLEGLKLFDVSGDADKKGIPDDVASVSTTARDVDEYQRRAEADHYVTAEFETGMERLLQSYARVSTEEAFATAQGGLDGARAALVRQAEEEEARQVRKEEAGEEDGSDSDLESHFEELYRDNGEQWDCETILTTYTNLDNHPSVIEDAAPHRSRAASVFSRPPVIRLDPRTQAPAEFIPEDHASSAHGQIDYGSRRPAAAPGGKARGRDETREDKKARKAAVKEAARERRALKSEMKKAFGSEHVKQGRHSAALGKSKVAIQL